MSPNIWFFLYIKATGVDPGGMSALHLLVARPHIFALYIISLLVKTYSLPTTVRVSPLISYCFPVSGSFPVWIFVLDDGFGEMQNDRYALDQAGGARVVVRVIRTRAPFVLGRVCNESVVGVCDCKWIHPNPSCWKHYLYLLRWRSKARVESANGFSRGDLRKVQSIPWPDWFLQHRSSRGIVMYNAVSFVVVVNIIITQWWNNKTNNNNKIIIITKNCCR